MQEGSLTPHAPASTAWPQVVAVNVAMEAVAVAAVVVMAAAVGTGVVAVAALSVVEVSALTKKPRKRGFFSSMYLSV